jgi:hypothetical protein
MFGSQSRLIFKCPYHYPHLKKIEILIVHITKDIFPYKTLLKANPY